MKRTLIIALLAACVLLGLQPLRRWLQTDTATTDSQASGQAALHSGHGRNIDTTLYNALLADACHRQHKCDQPARLLAGHAPQYPPLAHAQGRDGYALMRFAIRSDGGTEAIEVVSSSEPAFAQAASEAIAGWHLEPARFMGKTQPQASIRLEFVIRP